MLGAYQPLSDIIYSKALIWYIKVLSHNMVQINGIIIVHRRDSTGSPHRFTVGPTSSSCVLTLATGIRLRKLGKFLFQIFVGLPLMFQ